MRKAPKRICRRQTTTIDEAVGLALAQAGDVRGTYSLVICTRIGEAAYVPPGYRTADCFECESAVWICREIVDASERRGMEVVPICGECALICP